MPAKTDYQQQADRLDLKVENVKAFLNLTKKAQESSPAPSTGQSTPSDTSEMLSQYNTIPELKQWMDQKRDVFDDTSVPDPYKKELKPVFAKFRRKLNTLQSGPSSQLTPSTEQITPSIEREPQNTVWGRGRRRGEGDPSALEFPGV